MAKEKHTLPGFKLGIPCFGDRCFIRGLTGYTFHMRVACETTLSVGPQGHPCLACLHKSFLYIQNLYINGQLTLHKCLQSLYTYIDRVYATVQLEVPHVTVPSQPHKTFATHFSSAVRRRHTTRRQPLVSVHYTYMYTCSCV